MSYLKQLKTHKESLEINLKQFDNDIEHAQRGIELLTEQKEAVQKQLLLIEQSITEEENKEA